MADAKKETVKEAKIPVVRLFCGKDTPAKRYEAYFKGKLNLVTPTDSSAPIALCHSRGIIEALQSDAKYIVAMDPTVLSDDKRVVHWLPGARECTSTTANVVRYTMPDGMEHCKHYPYTIKAIRDKIVQQICSFAVQV